MKIEYLIILGVAAYFFLYKKNGGGAAADQLLTVGGGGLSPSGTVYMVPAVPGMAAHDVGGGWWTPII